MFFSPPPDQPGSTIFAPSLLSSDQVQEQFRIERIVLSSYMQLDKYHGPIHKEQSMSKLEAS